MPLLLPIPPEDVSTGALGAGLGEVREQLLAWILRLLAV